MAEVLVTGGCGFIGSKIVERLLEENYHVIVVDNLSTGKIENINTSEVTFYNIDIIDERIEEIFKKHSIKYVIHQAAQTSVPYSINHLSEDTNINIYGSIKIIDLSKKYNVAKIIFASSAAVYGDNNDLPIKEDATGTPTSPYGLAKLTVEEYLLLAKQLYGLDYSILRYSNVYGPKQTTLGEGGVVSIFCDLLSRGERPIIYGDGNQTRDFVYVKDVADANVKALTSEPGIYNISSNNPTKIIDLFHEISLHYEVKKNPLFKEERKGDIRHSLLCNKKSLKYIQWTPKTSLEEGIKLTVSGMNI